MTIALRTLPAVPLAGLLLAGTAQAETRASALISADAGYGSNPYLSGTGNQEAGSLIARVAPTITFAGPTSTANVSGRLEEIVFTDRHKDMTNWSLGGGASLSLSPLSKLGANVSYSSQVQNSLTDAYVPGEDLPPLDPSTAALAGTRINTLSGGVNFSTSISARDTISLDAFASKVDYDSATVLSGSVFSYDYKSYGGSAGFSHAVNEKASVGLSIAFSKTDYESVLYGNFRQISPSANGTLKLSPRLTLIVSAGASFSHIEQLLGTSDQVHFSGEANLCHDGARTKICVYASQQVGASGAAGTSSITAAGFSYSYRLTPRSTLSASGQYSESKSLGLTGGSGISYGYGIANVAYRRDIGRRLSVSATARYTEPFKSIGGARRGFYAAVGVNYRLGR